MTPEAQRIAIAEACGWKKGTTGFWKDPDKSGYYPSPDYLNDLNAMHEAEKVLGDFGTPVWRRYQNHIAKGDVAVPCGVIAHATAAQRAEAFLRTFNLWKDE